MDFLRPSSADQMEHDDETVNRVNKVAFELIISFHVRGFRETGEGKIAVEGRDEATALIIISPRIILYPFHTDRSVPFSDLRVKIRELVEIQGKC